MTPREKLREMLVKREKIMAPGAYDAWSAMLIEKAGFPAVYMTGYGVSASMLGKPDIGLLTQTEMTMAAKNISEAVNLPVIADADTGYGGNLNVIRTVKEYEKAGVSAIQLEDQVFPKRCGHMEGKEVISKEEMAAKIRAAAYARKDKNLVIIARTDARAMLGFDEALSRAKAYVEAGADVIFFEAPQSVEEMKKVAAELKVPLLANMVEKGKTPLLTADELTKMGFNLIIYPASLLYTATNALNIMLKRLKDEETTANMLSDMITFGDFNDSINLAKLRDIEKSFTRQSVYDKIVM
ncbi:MAG: isocitrate lyase/PEP mutase family protein [Lachnospiraceae bacterium]|nr:isocitrate lyase/PEP mutase family protein [Lachnospiraceae bacterium]